MRVVTESMLGSVLAGLEGEPRVVVSGNFATPWQAVKVLDAALPEYRFFALNAQAGIPDRDGSPSNHPSSAQACGQVAGCATCRAGSRSYRI